MTTIVSALFSGINNRKDFNLEKYVELGKLWLKVPVNKIIFADDFVFPHLEHFSNENTKVYLYNKEDFYLYDVVNKNPGFKLQITTDNPSKDTLDYLILMCNKTEFLRRTIELNPFRSQNFVWIDFGINYVLKYTPEELEEKITVLSKKVYNKIRIPHIWDLETPRMISMMPTSIQWFFAGGVFGGPQSSLLDFANKMKEKCIEMIAERGTLTWEVNLWYLVYIENKNLFLPYYGNHDRTIIENY